jgi:glycosyltransferase involved in cell wall biosynthesis
MADGNPERPLRILAVGSMYPPHHAGGYELAWQAAARHAREIGHPVRIVTSDYRAGGGRPEEDPDVHRTLRWYWDLDRYDFPTLGLTQRARLERHNAAELRRHVADWRPDVVCWWSMGCLSLSMIEQVRRAGLPAAFVVHDDWLVYGWQHDQWIRIWRGWRRRLAPAAERVLGVPTRVDVASAGALVFNSSYTLERAREAGVDVRGATVIHPGIDERFLEEAPTRAWRWRLTYVGRIDRQKGIDTAVRALADLPAAATLTVHGSGDQRYVAELRALADELGVPERLEFRGFANAAAVRLAYEDADVVVFPVRWNEPFGLVPLEAMATGRPVVSTARGGTAEFLRDGDNALVFEPDDAAALAACVTRLAVDASLRSRLRAGGRRTAVTFPASEFAVRTVEAIVRAARPRPLAAARAQVR